MTRVGLVPRRISILAFGDGTANGFLCLAKSEFQQEDVAEYDEAHRILLNRNDSNLAVGRGKNLIGQCCVARIVS
jgi:hypothetical protein